MIHTFGTIDIERVAELDLCRSRADTQHALDGENMRQ